MLKVCSVMSALFVIMTGAMSAADEPFVAHATAETESVPHQEDAADDPSIWLHPLEPEKSLLVLTDKKGGLMVCGLDGRKRQYIDGMLPNNVDVGYGFQLGGKAVDIAVVSDRQSMTVKTFAIDTDTGTLRDITAPKPAPVIDDLYGICLYRSESTGGFYAFVTCKSGEVHQLALNDDGAGAVSSEVVRTLQLSSQAEGCVADSFHKALYVAEESVALWKFDAEPDGQKEPLAMVDQPMPKGHFTPDLEGLAIFHGEEGAGYLIASSQGDNRYLVYRREGDNTYLGSFTLAGKDTVDDTTHTDGLDVIASSLGSAYPQGLFIAQDDDNSGQPQNFKMTPWQHIAGAFQPALDANPLYNPRDKSMSPANP